MSFFLPLPLFQKNIRGVNGWRTSVFFRAEKQFFTPGGSGCRAAARAGRGAHQVTDQQQRRKMRHKPWRAAQAFSTRSKQTRVPAPSANSDFRAQALASAFLKFHPPANDYERHPEAPSMNSVAPMQLIRSTQFSLSDTLSGRIQAHKQTIKESATAKKRTYWSAIWLNKKEMDSSISTAATRTAQAIHQPSKKNAF